jgi:hypothetical protein
LGNVKMAGEFTTTYSILAIGEQPQSGEPFVQTNSGILANTTYLYREFAAGMMFRALPSLTSRVELANPLRTTDRADNAIGPATDSQIVDAVIWIREVNDCFLKALWLAHGLALHKQNYRANLWASQVNNHPLWPGR